MSTGAPAEDDTLAPDDAFGVLGNEIRMDILQTLGAAEGPLPFSELRERVGVRDSGQFNYHLDQLNGHFVIASDDGYQLQRAGERVIEAVLSGAVTEAPVLDPTPIEMACWQCGAPIEVGYRQEHVGIFCTECEGTYGNEPTTQQKGGPTDRGRLGHVRLPPAGVRGRAPKDVLEVASIWSSTDALTMAKGVCPRCSAVVEHSVRACGDHDTSKGRCEQCDRRVATLIEVQCTNCIYEQSGVFMLYLLARPEVRIFLLDHDVDPWSVDRFSLSYDEDIRSTDPFEAAFTFTIEGDVLTLTVDDDLSIVNVNRDDLSDPA